MGVRNLSTFAEDNGILSDPVDIQDLAAEARARFAGDN
jgi:hypothetical protein